MPQNLQPSRTYGDYLEAATRAELKGACRDWRLEAIQDLATRWLISGRWHEPAPHEGTVQLAIRNVVRDILRSEARASRPASLIGHTPATGPARIELQQLARDVGEANAHVLTLHAMGFTAEEIAAQQGRTGAAVRKQLSRARRNLPLRHAA